MNKEIIGLITKNLLTAVDMKIFCQQMSMDMPNINFPTMGGIFFWNDIYEIDGWRVQQHTVTKHCRVLDQDDIRKAWGTEDKMISNLNKFISVYR